MKNETNANSHSGKASQYRPPDESSSLPRMEWEQGVAGDRFNELVAAGCERDEINSFLIVLKILGLIDTELQPNFLPQNMTQRILKNLPSRIERMAEEVDRVNRHNLFDPRLWIPKRPDPPLHPWIQRDFVTLPAILRLYAVYIASRIGILNTFRQGYGRRGFEKRNVIRKLLQYVWHRTGSPHYEALAELLSHALPDDPTYDASALRHLHTQHADASGKPSRPGPR